MATKNIVLVGLMATGKTTIGKLLGQKLDRSVLDTDDMIEAAAGKTISEIFSEDGEGKFRELESQMFTEACQKKEMIISTGGGAMQREENNQLAQTQQTIHLRSTAKTLAQRIELSDQKRPLVEGLKGKDLIDLAQKYIDERDENYTKAAAFIIDTDDKTPDEISEKIIQELEEK